MFSHLDSGIFDLTTRPDSRGLRLQCDSFSNLKKSIDLTTRPDSRGLRRSLGFV
ncbi:hypothetical protein [Helicobacter pullorum]|uniref:hypothetical protein n=1 Tax=Helicobacter pullorum TaxID=35818 RepID=UPI0012D71B78|nr:hypothetical protein [Helicobacter pullorum]